MGILAAAVFAVVPIALADTPPLPWAGGGAVETPFEEYAGQQASAVAGRPVKVNWNGATDRGELGAE